MLPLLAEGVLREEEEREKAEAAAARRGGTYPLAGPPMRPPLEWRAHRRESPGAAGSHVISPGVAGSPVDHPWGGWSTSGPSLAWLVH